MLVTGFWFCPGPGHTHSMHQYLDCIEKFFSSIFMAAQNIAWITVFHLAASSVSGKVLGHNTRLCVEMVHT